MVNIGVNEREWFESLPSLSTSRVSIFEIQGELSETNPNAAAIECKWQKSIIVLVMVLECESESEEGEGLVEGQRRRKRRNYAVVMTCLFCGTAPMPDRTAAILTFSSPSAENPAAR